MSSITDIHGKTYELRLTAPMIRRIKNHAGVNITHLDGDPLSVLANDPELFIDVLWILCRSQFQADPNATDPDGELLRADEQFGESLPHDILDQASAALLEAIIDFFPAGKRSSLRSLAETLERKRELATQAMLQRIQTEEFDQKVVDAAVSAGMQALEARLAQAFTGTEKSARSSGPPISVSYSTDGMP
jgi:hypothetical protein